MNTKKIKINNMKDTIKYLRIRKDITQEEIAQILNITRSAYANYEQGRRTPDLDTIAKLSEYYDVSIDYIIGNEKEKVLDEQCLKLIQKIKEKDAITMILENFLNMNENKRYQLCQYSKFLLEN